MQDRLVYVRNTEHFTTKSKRNRVVPMHQTVFDLMSRLPQNTQRVFVRVDGGPWTSGYVSHLFKKYIRSASLKECYHFHTLRHTFASWLVQRGANLYEVKELLGHSNITTTQIYAHLQPEQLHSTVNKISLPLN